MVWEQDGRVLSRLAGGSRLCVKDLWQLQWEMQTGTNKYSFPSVSLVMCALAGSDR